MAEGTTDGRALLHAALELLYPAWHALHLTYGPDFGIILHEEGDARQVVVKLRHKLPDGVRLARADVGPLETMRLPAMKPPG